MPYYQCHFFIYLFIHQSRLVFSNIPLLIGACLWIASSRAALNQSNSISLFSEVTWIILFLTSNKHLITSVPFLFEKDFQRVPLTLFDVQQAKNKQVKKPLSRTETMHKICRSIFFNINHGNCFITPLNIM